MASPNDDLVAITAYFNPCSYVTRRQNYEVFSQSLKLQGVPLITIECLFPQSTAEVPASDNVITVRARDIMWQKERILNVALASLPRRFKKVAWLDSDVLFPDSTWADRASRLLDDYPVLQLFSGVTRLNRDPLVNPADLPSAPSFAKVFRKDPGALRWGFRYHGHSGFAWASRRDVIEQLQFYDACLTGSGDHLMAHAFCGDYESPCVQNMLRRGSAYWRHFVRWAKHAGWVVRGQVGVLDCHIHHLWHGEIEKRQYHERNLEFRRFDFDPTVDVVIDEGSCWRWASEKRALHEWSVDYFQKRFEDG